MLSHLAGRVLWVPTAEGLCGPPAGLDVYQSQYFRRACCNARFGSGVVVVVAGVGIPSYGDG